MNIIESPYALIALRKMAAYTPERLLKMEEEEPQELLKEIEMRVTNALGWADTAMGKGASREKLEESIALLLKPDNINENAASIAVSEQKINEIYQRLLSLGKRLKG